MNQGLKCASPCGGATTPFEKKSRQKNKRRTDQRCTPLCHKDLPAEKERRLRWTEFSEAHPHLKSTNSIQPPSVIRPPIHPSSARRSSHLRPSLTFQSRPCIRVDNAHSLRALHVAGNTTRLISFRGFFSSSIAFSQHQRGRSLLPQRRLFFFLLHPPPLSTQQSKRAPDSIPITRLGRYIFPNSLNLRCLNS